MIHDASIAVAFYLDGERYAMRLWRHVPRKSDEVMLNAPKGEGDGKMAFKVRRVVWGVEADTDKIQAVNIEIERIS